MTWQQTLIIAAVPAVVTAISLVLQQWLTRRHETRTVRAAHQHEFATMVRSERIEFLTRVLTEVSELAGELESLTASAISGRRDEQPARWPRVIPVNHELLGRIGTSAIAAGLICGPDVSAAVNAARTALIDWGASLQEQGSTVGAIRHCAADAGTRIGKLTALGASLTLRAPGSAA